MNLVIACMQQLRRWDFTNLSSLDLSLADAGELLVSEQLIS